MIIAVDGACRNNGRDGPQAAYGVYFNERCRSNEAGIFSQAPITNQCAEIYAAIMALEICCEKLDACPPSQRVRSIVIQSDSTYLVNGITSWITTWRENNYMTSQGSPVRNRDMFSTLDDMVANVQSCGVTVYFRHVGREQNTKADRLANSAFSRFAN